MNKVIRKENVSVMIEKEVEKFVTSDGNEYGKKENAQAHEEILKKFSKLSKYDIEWLEHLKKEDFDGDKFEEFEKVFKSNNVILAMDHSGGDNCCFIVVEPVLAGVKAVIKALHRKTVGMNCNSYVRSLIYKEESFSFDEEKVGGGYHETGSGKNIKEILTEWIDPKIKPEIGYYIGKFQGITGEIFINECYYKGIDEGWYTDECNEISHEWNLIAWKNRGDL